MMIDFSHVNHIMKQIFHIVRIVKKTFVLLVKLNTKDMKSLLMEVFYLI